MIVVGIIALLAAISIPVWKSAFVRADETAAIATIKKLVAAEEMWRVNNPAYAGMTELIGGDQPYITGVDYYGGWSQIGQYGFIIWPNVSGPGTYSIIAWSGRPGIYYYRFGATAARSFCATEDGMVRVMNSVYPNCDGNFVAK